MRKIDLATWQDEDNYVVKTKLLFGRRKEVSANLLSTTELRTKKTHSLSLWHLAEDDSNLKRIIAAFSASGQSLDDIAYVVLDESLLKAAGIKISRSNGSTPDAQANAEWHFDMQELSARDLARVANIIGSRALKAERTFRAEVIEFIIESLANNWMKVNKFPNMGKEDKKLLSDRLREIRGT